MLPDILAPDLLVVFVGTSKSTTSARAGHYYANPQNMFWNLLEATGPTGVEWIGPSRDESVLRYLIGLTDLVPGRAASSDALLKAGDYDLPGFIAEDRAVRADGGRLQRRGGRHEGCSAPQTAQTGRGTGDVENRGFSHLPIAIVVERPCDRGLRGQAGKVARVRALGQPTGLSPAQADVLTVDSGNCHPVASAFRQPLSEED